MINKELKYEDFKPFLGLCLDLRYLALLNNTPGVEQHEVINDLEKVLEKLNLKLIKVEFEKNSDHYWTRAIVPANLDILLHLSVFEKIKGLIIGTGGENVNRIKSRYFIILCPDKI